MSEGDKWRWSKTSERKSQDKFFLHLISQVFCHTNGKLTEIAYFFSSTRCLTLDNKDSTGFWEVSIGKLLRKRPNCFAKMNIVLNHIAFHFTKHLMYIIIVLPTPPPKVVIAILPYYRQQISPWSELAQVTWLVT
jgi:hypothetical protein